MNNNNHNNNHNTHHTTHNTQHTTHNTQHTTHNTPHNNTKKVFLFSRNSHKRFWGLVLWYLKIGRAKNSGPGSPRHLAVEVFKVGSWHIHGDLALDAGLDFLAVTEHRLIPAWVRNE